MKVSAIRFYKTIVFVLAFPVLALHLNAQPAGGSVHGQVTDSSGAVITDTTVVAESAAGPSIRVKTDRLGNYSFQNLPQGQYTINIVSHGFAAYRQETIVIQGQNQKLDIVLHVEAQHIEVTVNGGNEGMDANNPAANSDSLVIKGKDLEALSDDPDELEAQLQALAGPAAGPNGGQIYIDGFTGGKLPPKNSIREIRINQNPFSAEFDKIGYGRIEVLTKPGGNSLHGRFLLEGNDSSFNARNPFLSEKPDYYTTSFDASADGPVYKKGSFFITAARRLINDTGAVDALILDPNLNPVAFNQAVPNARRLTIINPRIDYQLTANNLLSTRYQWYDSSDSSDGVGQFSLSSQAYSLRKTEHSLQLSDSQFVSPTAANDLHFEYRHDTMIQVALSSGAQISVLGAFTGGASNQGNSSTTQNYLELRDGISLSRGPHTLRFGGRVRATWESDVSTQNFNGTFLFSSLTAFRTTEFGLQQGLTPAQIRAGGGGASLFTIVDGMPSVSGFAVDGGVFAMDDWRLRPNVTLSYGLRYEVQNNLHDYTDFAPRVGFAWGLGRTKKYSVVKTVLRAGVGVFYDRLTQNLVLNSLRLNGINTQQFVIAQPDFFPNIPALASLQASKIPPTLYQIQPDLVSPLTLQSAATLERKLSRNSTVAVTYLNSRGYHEFLSRNINAPLPGTFNPQQPTSGVRPLGNIGDVYQYQSEGLFVQNQLTTTFSVRAASWLNLRGYYVFSHADSNTGGATSFPSNQYDLNADYGRAAYDVRHRLALFSAMDLPGGFRFIPFILASSGRPFDITTGRDLNGDSIFNDRPAFATDLSRPSVVVTPLGAFDTAPVPGQTIIPPNFGNGPAQVNFNFRFNKSFALGKMVDDSSSGHASNDKPDRSSTLGGTWRPQWTLRFDVIVANVLNYVNAGTPIGNLTSPLFGKSNALSPSLTSTTNANRQVSLQMQIIF